MDIMATTASINIYYAVSGDELAALNTQPEKKEGVKNLYVKRNELTQLMQELHCDYVSIK